MAKLPSSAYPKEWMVSKISAKFEGQGAIRRAIGTQITGHLLFDNLAAVPIFVPGLDTATLPSPEYVTERNLNMDFLLARFENLEVTFSGGDYGTIRYKGTATGVEFLNLTPPATPPRTAAGK